MNYVTNVDTFLEIAIQAANASERHLNECRVPRPDGEKGFIVTPDPDRKSFKQAAVAQAFACIYFEAVCYIYLLEKYGDECARCIDKRVYEERLKALGVKDKKTLDAAKRLRISRKDLVHEKAYPVGKPPAEIISCAQKESEIAVTFVKDIERLIKDALKQNEIAEREA